MNNRQLLIGASTVAILVVIMFFEYQIYYIFTGGPKVYYPPDTAARVTMMKNALQITVLILGSLLVYVFRD